jgi:hypothetical protein
MVTDPETLTGLIHDLALVGGDKPPIGRDGVCQAHTRRLQAGYVVVAHRHRELGARRIGNLLLTVILRERAAAFWYEDLRNDHACPLKIARTYRARGLSPVAIRKIPHEAATVAVY